MANIGMIVVAIFISLNETEVKLPAHRAGLTGALPVSLPERETSLYGVHHARSVMIINCPETRSHHGSI